MDAFFASVEVRERPELAGRPVIVGGLGPRSVVLSATYQARKFGVGSAMPMARARRLCPSAIVVPPRHGRYSEVSRRVMRIFREVTPEVEPLSLDEAFLDVSGARRRLGTPRAIAELIRARVAEQERITCSVGVATTKFVAKLASVACKPDGLLVVPADGVLEFLHPLPVSALWGVGERTERALDRLGLHTVGEVAGAPVQALAADLGPAVAAHLHALAWGHDDRPVVTSSREKSIGAEETFDTDIADPGLIRRELLRLADRTARALRASAMTARTIGVKLRRADYRTITRARTLGTPTDVAREIHQVCCELYAASGLEGRALRLVGVRASGLIPAGQRADQLRLGERAAIPWRAAERATDAVARKFGTEAIRRAALIVPSGTAHRHDADHPPGR